MNKGGFTISTFQATIFSRHLMRRGESILIGLFVFIRINPLPFYPTLSRKSLKKYIKLACHHKCVVDAIDAGYMQRVFRNLGCESRAIDQWHGHIA